LQQFARTVRFHLDGLRLHPKRRLITVALVGGLLGAIILAITIINIVVSAPQGSPPPRPMGLLPEVAEGPRQLDELKSLSGLVIPNLGSGGWRLVGGTASTNPDRAETRSWMFMLAPTDNRAAKVTDFKKLAPDVGKLVPALALSESFALELGRMSVGKAVEAWKSARWKVQGGGDAAIDILETDLAVVARVVWVKTTPR